ncbi:putative sulfate transporter with a STAS domain (C-terminal) [Bradyrhizobium sp. ORS 285]|uniref:SulP family inorganic anion transporter n=1 Tax=Bradyrhizobium sp. ORS 285 TaxID=115808 RepID=UPI000240676F|nr:SulP family inorganic anion transporter [Bradyrhizobium sp. ORS 285]CCD86042.1 putative sulfate transporter with a STAS domain (C-terminal) [Bradyrhizobium sp. ORS 285]SMX56783.1 putative sulfate transporter with a STAS domain (C-terminal) [Bradyrhizobium sp. ORS 285]
MTEQTHDGNHHWPMLRSLRGWRLSALPADLTAGLTLAAIAIPEQMATAKLGGFTPETGFFAFLAGSLGFALFGANRFLSCGADSTITPIFAGGLALLAASGTPEYGSLAAALALLVGVMLVLAGGFRLGGIANLLSVPVTVGFLAGISVHIIVSQLPSVLGLPSPSGPTLARIAALAGELGKTNIYTLIIGFGVLTVTVCERISARIPGALIALVAATLFVMAAHLEARGVPVIGAISGDLPMPSMPLIGPEQWVKLVPLAFLIAVVVMMQTAATTRSFPSEPDRPADVDRDFLGAGAGSLLAGLFATFPVNASPPRTGIVVETGGRSQVAGLSAAVVVLLLVLFGARLLAHVPDAALGGVLLFVALRIIRVTQIVQVYHASKGEFLLIVATAAAIVVLPIEQGVALGIALSLLHGIWSTTRAHLITFERVPDTTIWWPAHPHIRGEELSEIAVVGFQAPLSFLNAATFRADLQHLLQRRQPRLLVLEASAMVEIDFTAAQALREVIRQCNADGIVFAVARLESLRAQAAFERFGLYDVLPRDRVFHSVDRALQKLTGPS